MKKFFSRLIAKIKRDSSGVFKVLVLRVLGIALLNKSTNPSKHYFPLVANSGILLDHSGTDSYKVFADWSASDALWIRGEYQAAIQKRKEILSNLYEINGNNSDDYFPPAVSVGFLGPIGHQALLGVHIAAQRLGILSEGKRSAARVLSEEPKPILDSFGEYLNFTHYSAQPAWTELPNHWHAAERVQLVKAKSGFIDLYEMIENVFSTGKVNPENPFFQLSSDYVKEAKYEFEKLGLQQDQWFVGLHIRNDGPNPARRNQPVESYLKAISEVTSRGGWVIRIGDPTMSPLPKMPKVIDLVPFQNSGKKLHAFVLSNCRFFIGTSSGPSSIPALFGVPTLITNTTSIGRNTLTAAEHSIYVPKILRNLKGDVISFKKVLESPDGFGELELLDLERLGFRLESNTDSDILRSVIEMFDRIDGKVIPNQDEFRRRVSEIRAKLPWTSQGEFSVSFLERHQDRFLV